MNQISMCPIVSFGFKMVAFYKNWSNDFYLLFSYLRLSDALCHKICHFYTRNCCIHLTDGEFQEYAKQKRNKSRYGVLPYQNNLVCVELLLELNKLQRTWTMVTPLTCMLNCLCREKHKDLWLVWNHYQVCYHHL